MTSTLSARRQLDDVALSITARSSQHGRGTPHPTHWLICAQVSARQYNASRGATVARRKSARKFITRNVAVTHDDTKGFTPWLPIRAAIEYASARRGFDWLAMVEDDSVLHL